MSTNPYDPEDDADFGAWLDEQADAARMELGSGPSYSESDPKEPEPDNDADDARLQSWIEQKAAGASGLSYSPKPAKPNYSGINTGLSDGSKAAMVIAGLGSLFTAGRKNDRGFDAAYWQGERDRADKIGAQYAQANAKAASSDPISGVSMRRKAALAPMLREFGVTDADLEQMSADDLASINGGDLLRDIGTLRRQAAARSDAARRAAETRAAEADQYEQRRADRMSDEKAIIDYRNAGKPARAGGVGAVGYAAPVGDTDVALVATRIPDSATPEQKAAVEAQLKAVRGMRGKQRAQALALAENSVRQLEANSDQAFRQQDAARKESEAKAAKEAESAARKVEREADRADQDAKFYGQELRTRGVDRARASLQNVLEEMRRAGVDVDSALANPDSLGQDIPGYGATGVLPNMLVSQKAEDLRGAYRRLLDTELRVATGANAPPSEVQTFRDILGVGAMDSDRDMVRALAQAKRVLDTQEGYVREMFPNAPQTVRARGQQAQPKATQRSDGKVRVRRNGQIGWVSNPKPTDEVL